MAFENESMRQAPGALNAIDSHEKPGQILFDEASKELAAQGQLQKASYEGLFGSPVIDFRMAQAPAAQVEAKDYCDTLPRTKSMKDSLAATEHGESMLNRMFEIAAKTPQGITLAKDFEALFGKDGAAKMVKLGLESINKQGASSTLKFKQPIVFGESGGTVTIDTNITFDTVKSGGAISIENLTGVSGQSGIFSVPIDRLDMQPHPGGYVSAVVDASMFSKDDSATANPLFGKQVKLCAFPNGTIYH
jgi:hypothetical protein